MTSPPKQPRQSAERRMIVLPDVDRDESLVDEFGQHLSVEAIERAIAAARHALERSHQPATPEAVKRLAREHLQSRVATLTGRRR